uniref:Uncharacterized protein n=2 Tax=Caenorhabditis japonica TaxID=281687 RepID=A0A8R1E7A8_CAEJA
MSEISDSGSEAVSLPKNFPIPFRDKMISEDISVSVGNNIFPTSEKKHVFLSKFDKQCQEELDTTYQCLQIQKKIPISNEKDGLEIGRRISKVIDCMGRTNCNLTRTIESFLYNEKWWIEVYSTRLQPCLQDEVLSEIQKQCNCPVLRYFGNTDCPKDFETVKLFSRCAVQELKKRTECTAPDRRLFQKLFNALRARYLIGKQIKVEIDHSNVVVPRGFDLNL